MTGPRQREALALARLLRSHGGAHKPRLEWRCDWDRARDQGCLVLRVYVTVHGTLVHSPRRRCEFAGAQATPNGWLPEWAAMLDDLAQQDMVWDGLVSCRHEVADFDARAVRDDLEASMRLGVTVLRHRKPRLG